MLRIYHSKLTDFETYSNDTLLSYVSESTKKEVVLYKIEKVRRTKLLGEAMVHQLIRTIFGIHQIKIIKGPHGKPYLKNKNQKAFFNLSHSGDYVICAISDREVGVDIEKIGRARMEVAHRFFHLNEVKLLGNLLAEDQRNLFFRYWSAKESYLKYTGSGLSSPLSSFEVCFEENDIHIKKEHSRLPLCIRECFIDKDYKCFVCSEENDEAEIFPFQLETV